MRRLRDNESGLAAVEFALVVPVLIVLILGSLEYSFILFTQNIGQNAVRDIARQLATQRLTTESAPSAVKAQLPRWASNDAVVTVSQSAQSDPAKNAFSVAVSIPRQAATPINFFFQASGGTVTAKAVFQQEVSS